MAWTIVVPVTMSTLLPYILVHFLQRNRMERSVSLGARDTANPWQTQETRTPHAWGLPPGCHHRWNVWVHESPPWSRSKSLRSWDLKRCQAHPEILTLLLQTLDNTSLELWRRRRGKGDLTHKHRFCTSKITLRKMQGSEGRRMPNPLFSPNVLIFAPANSFVRNVLCHCIRHSHPQYLHLCKSCFLHETYPSSAVHLALPAWLLHTHSRRCSKSPLLSV